MPNTYVFLLLSYQTCAHIWHSLVLKQHTENEYTHKLREIKQKNVDWNQQSINTFFSAVKYVQILRNFWIVCRMIYRNLTRTTIYTRTFCLVLTLFLSLPCYITRWWWFYSFISLYLTRSHVLNSRFFHIK